MHQKRECVCICCFTSAVNSYDDVRRVSKSNHTIPAQAIIQYLFVHTHTHTHTHTHKIFVYPDLPLMYGID